MDFVFHCASCRGPLVARTHLRGLHVQCAHCASGTEVGSGKPVTEAVVRALLDTPVPLAPSGQHILRRVRPAPRHSSAGAGAAHDRPRLPRTARISHIL